MRLSTSLMLNTDCFNTFSKAPEGAKHHLRLRFSRTV
jgi:hypothetical protein